MLTQWSQSKECQNCKLLFPVQKMIQGSILARLCDECSLKQRDTRSSVLAAIVPKPSQNQPPEQKLEGQGKGQTGVKDDGGKLMWHLLPWKAVGALVSVLTFGAKKYSPNGWKAVPNAKDRYLAAALRHVSAHATGEKVDPESGLSHLSHAMCNIAFLIELED